MLLCPIRPNLCWIGLFSLDFRHLADWMLFAGYAEQQHAEQNSNDAVAEEKTHTALAPLSVSRATCKNESAVVGRDHGSLAVARAFRSWWVDHDHDHDHDYEHEHERR
jgi:hypothetical protein